MKGVQLIPNALTTASLFCGFFSVVKALSGDYLSAAWAILLAGLFDLLDGRLAKMTGGESQFGIEYDSLVDLSSFGLAPGILIYTWTLSDLGKLGWLAAFLFFACGALRLARYNVQHGDVEERFFQGLPIPMAAYSLTTFVIFYEEVAFYPPAKNYVVALLTMALALLMVSNIRYRSIKGIELNLRNSFFALVILVVGIVIVAARPEITMFLFVTGYVASGIVEELVTLRQSRSLVAHVKQKRAERRKNDEGPHEI